MKKKNFLAFMAWLSDPDCPWGRAIVTTNLSYIDVVFVTSRTVHPSYLGWLNTHAVGGRWFITPNDDELQIVVRFDDEEEVG